MSLRGGTDLGIMQIMGIYFPIGYQEEGLLDQITWQMAGYYSPMCEKNTKTGLLRASIDDHFTNEGKETAIYPVVAWDVVSITGFSNDVNITCGLDSEWQAIGNDIFEEQHKQIYKILMPYFRRHPDLRERAYSGRLVGPKKRLSQAKYPLCVNVPLLWSYWSQYDDYSMEMDVEVWLIGELNMSGLNQAL